jgi:pyrrolidone-carboxylate peptidase
MRDQLGHDFTQVRVHTDTVAADSARDVQARAYTVGAHVVFGAVQYRPDTTTGHHLLMHELAHVIQQRSQPWTPNQPLRISQPSDTDEIAADNWAADTTTPLAASMSSGRAVIHRAWDSDKSTSCPDPKPDTWLQKVVVDQEKAQSITLHWSDGSVSASICSTGKGHCCVDGSDPKATAASVSESRRSGSNATPIGSGFLITDNEESHNGWKFWNTFIASRGIALHQHHTVTGTPLSHGCVRLPEETAQAIFCGARQRQTRVEVRGFARPDCAEPELQAEWKSDFASAAVTDGEPTDAARIIREAYGRSLSQAELERGRQGELAIPRCGFRGAAPGTEAARSLPETGAAANVPSASSEVLARSGLEGFLPLLANSLDRARTLPAARSTVQRIGQNLWTAGTRAAQRGRGDDRPLYWARVQMTRAIQQWEAQFPLSAAERKDLIEAFDRASRGMESALFNTPTGRKRIVISGFDPFGLEQKFYSGARATNPSGAAALALDGRMLTNGKISGAVEGVVFPVSFAAFDAGTVERFFRPYLSGPGHADMIMTISMGISSEFEVEEYAARSRQSGSADNPGVTPTAPGPPPGLPAGPEFLRGTLPASARRSLGRTRPLPSEVEITEIPAGSRTPVSTTTGPTRGSTAVEGSGGGYLSNEIFYRVGLLRLREGSSIPFGHLHVPFLSPNMRGFEAQRDQIVRRVEEILTTVLPDL